MREHDLGTCAFALVLDAEIPTEHRCDAEYAEQIAADERPVEALGAIEVAQIHCRGRKAAHSRPAEQMPAHAGQVVAAHRLERVVRVLALFDPDVVQVLRFRKRQRAHDQTADRDEHVDHASQTGSEHADHERCERGLIDDPAYRLFELEHQCAHGVPFDRPIRIAFQLWPRAGAADAGLLRGAAGAWFPRRPRGRRT